MRLTRISQDEGTLDGAENVALLSAAISGELKARGQSRDGVGLMLPLGPGGRLGKVSTQGGSDVGPLSVSNVLRAFLTVSLNSLPSGSMK